MIYGYDHLSAELLSAWGERRGEQGALAVPIWGVLAPYRPIIPGRAGI